MRISEDFFLDSIKIGALRIEKSYVVPLPGPSSGHKRPFGTASSSSGPKKTNKMLVSPKVDRYCPGGEGSEVHYSDGVFWDVTLNQVNILNNNNKFYIIQLLELGEGGFAVFMRWGRQGETGQTRLFDFTALAAAKVKFTSKFREKTHNHWGVGRAGFVPVHDKYDWLAMEAGEEIEVEMTASSSSRPQTINSMDTDEPSGSKTSLTLAKPSSGTCTLDPRVADLMQTIFDNGMMAKTVAAMNYDIKRQPLGKLSKATLKKALGVLKELEEVIISGKVSQAKISDFSNRFYTLIPHASGKQRLPYIDNLVILQEKLDLLEALNEIDAATELKKEDASSGDTKVHPLDRQYAQLNLKLTPLDRNSKTWSILQKWVQQTHAPTHTDYKLKILDIFEVDRPKDHAQFVPYTGLHNQTLLWHGSRMSNWVGILSQGLRIAPPEAPVTGYMFGKGVYFADLVSKSANYCATNKNDNVGFLMACQVALGDTYDKTAAEFIKKLKPQYHSCKGVGLSQPDPTETEHLDDGVGVPLGRIVPNPDVEESDLLYNEFIVYDIAQIKFRYFFKFQFLYK